MATVKKAPIKRTRPKGLTITEPVPETPKVKKVPATIQRAAKEFEDKKLDAKVIAERIAELQTMLVEYIEADGIKTISVGGRDFTRVQNEPVVTDEEKLKKIVGATVYKKLVTPVLDKKKVDDAIKSGLITVTQLAQASEVKKSKPYISMSK